MPTGLFDIRDRQPIFHPDEIAQGKAIAESKGLDYIEGSEGRAIPLARFVEILTKRWHRAVLTGQQIDAIRMGYCTIEPRGSPEPSRATH